MMRLTRERVSNMAKRITFIAIDPTGAAHKRTSDTRTYTHCVLVRTERDIPDQATVWGPATWVGRPDLVQAQLNLFSRKSWVKEAKAVPVIVQ